MSLSFKDIKAKKLLAEFIRNKGGGTQNAKLLNKRGRIYVLT